MELQDPRLLRDRSGHFLQYLLWRPPRDPKGGRLRPHWLLLLPLAAEGWFLAVVSPIAIGWWAAPLLIGLFVLVAALFGRYTLYPETVKDVLMIATRAWTVAGAWFGGVAFLGWFAFFR